MLLKTTSHHSGKKFYLRKFCLTIISLALVSIQINAQNGWTQKAQIPTPRAGVSASVIDNKIYVIGGYSPSFGNFAVNEVYDPSTDTWQTKSPLPQARGYLSCAVVNGIIYAIGGGYPTATKRVDAYDPISDTWTQKADMLSVRRSAQACVVDGIIYNIGGNHGVDQPSPECEAYDPITDTWTAKANMPAGGGNLAATVYNDSIYTFGGSINSTWSPFSYVYAYNPQTNIWTSKQSMPTARFGLIALLTNDHIYVIGGGSSQSSSLGTVEKYHPVTDTWEPGDNMPIISVFLTGAVVNEKIYVMGGTPDWSAGLANVWVYTPSPVPVELTSLTATTNGKEVTLNWSTATELNNQGFEVQRKFGSNDFVTIGSIKGHGTSTFPNQYLFVDKLIDGGKYFYRLKQLDFNGTFEYSNEIEVDVRSIDKFTLEQNYPNPFNPTTKIGYVLQEKSNVKLTLLNALGEEIAVLVNEEQDKGYHKVEFSAKGGSASGGDGFNLSSGVYFYKLTTENFVETKKMILLR